jgi:hypothetical protein
MKSTETVMDKDAPDTTEKVFSLRIPNDLLQRVAVLASRERRSSNGQILIAIEQHLGQASKSDRHPEREPS